ncbi:50S ribosomal protein L24e [Candidatus Woesearchaeota archaeon]|nr:50S ribosomal protein L24e [Candidatus Woesearchaeota archaeon]
MAKCSYCNKEIEKGTGKLFISKTGKIKWFCGSKCEKNAHKLKRNPRKVKWIKKQKKSKK